MASLRQFRSNDGSLLRRRHAIGLARPGGRPRVRVVSKDRFRSDNGSLLWRRHATGPTRPAEGPRVKV
eukprot:7928652-Alexandrium_andersonii.AAC.1